MAYTKTVWNDRIKDSQGNIVQEGTPVSAGNLNKIEKGIEDAHKQMEQAAKETVSLPYGLSVLNSPNGSPLDVQIEGRTLVSMGNSDLEGGKKYVLADPKTAVVIDGTIYKGISKFEGKNARPTIIRTANFEGKVSGSAVENPHLSKAGFKNTLLSPSGVWQNQDIETAGYTSMYTLDGKSRFVADSTSGSIAQMLFSFNIIEEIERKVGKIPGSTVADKVNWLKNNLNKLTCNWNGYGSGVGGNKANLVRWDAVAGAWTTPPLSHTSVSVSKITLTPTISTAIDANGLVHFLAYAEASDGVTASTINTDYVELDIELKSNADFYAPRVPLYEVPQESCDKILVEWDAAAVVKRYPMIEGAKSLQNPIVTVEGGNLLPPFSEWNLHAEASVISPYELEVSAAGLGRNSYVKVNVAPNTDYELICDTNGSVGVLYENEDKSFTGAGYTNAFPKKFNSGSNSVVRIFVTNYMSPAGKYNFSKPMLKLASVSSSEKPFVPRNPSYLYAETILRGLNNLNDMLYQDDGKWKVLKKWEEVLLDGTNPWAWHADFVGYKAIKVADAFGSITTSTNTSIYQVTNHLGALLKKLTTSSDLELNSAAAWFGNITGTAGIADVILTVPDTLTGWADSYTPTSDEIKAYFNGWKVKTVDGSNKPTAWVSALDGKDAPTQTLDYMKINKAPGYTGYRLLYQLSTTRVVDVTDKVEGSLSVSAQTQVSLDSGVIVKEKVIPVLASDNYYYVNGSNKPLSRRVKKILAVYKDYAQDDFQINSQFAVNIGTVGNEYARKPQESFDPTASYYVTYLSLDKETLTTNPVNVKASYNTSIRSTVDQMNEHLADVKSSVSIHDRYLYKLLLAAKANGWSV
ncbi:hypothetical protein V7079_22810 [Priestia megaterium]|uniref:hypothetical protein n=1 Tax=Priestia megaterium TaxID=1404 RepID=UPI0030009508